MNVKHAPHLSLVLLALLAGCASSPRPVQQAPIAPPPKPAPSAPAPAPAVSLAAEQKRLAELFHGTPVAWELTHEGALRVTVPLQYSFDKGKAAVKPPLAKVLDYVVTSAKAPGMKTRVHAPADNGQTAIAQERAASARDYLVGKGVPATQFAGVGPAQGDRVEVIVSR